MLKQKIDYSKILDATEPKKYGNPNNVLTQFTSVKLINIRKTENK